MGMLSGMGAGDVGADIGIEGRISTGRLQKHIVERIGLRGYPEVLWHTSHCQLHSAANSPR